MNLNMTWRTLTVLKPISVELKKFNIVAYFGSAIKLTFNVTVSNIDVAAL